MNEASSPLSLVHDAEWRAAFTRAGGAQALRQMGEEATRYDGSPVWAVGKFAVWLCAESGADITIGHDGDNISFHNPLAAALVCRAVLVEIERAE